MNPTALHTYQDRKSELDQELKRLNRLINRFSMARLGLIILGGAGIFKVVQTEQLWLTLISFFVVLIGFFWLVSKQAAYTKERKRVVDDLFVVQNELDCLDGKANSYDAGKEFVDEAHPYTSDLDVFGEKSIYHQINRAATKEGKERLASWLSQAVNKEEIEERQEAVKELAAEPRWCLDLLGRLVFNLKDRRDVKKILTDYLNKPETDFGSSILQYYVHIGPWLILACWICYYFFGGIFDQLALLLIVLNVLLAMGYAGKITAVSAGLGKMGGLLDRFSWAFSLVEGKAWTSERIGKMLLARGNANPTKALSLSMRRLGKLINNLDYRLNVLVGLFLNGLLLWDFRQVFAVIRWRQEHRLELGRIFDELGEVEALVSLAMLRINKPDWTWPRILSNSGHHLRMQEVKHPLIPTARSVENSYVREGHRMALITGSNMAGKSTFLRTVGANMVLAFCGAPVCATNMELSVVNVISYMRIRDSLNESISTFKAELNRLDMILKTVATDPESFFLIDEMLRGTNSMDKYLGSKAVIEKLIQERGVGMVATHDLQLAELEKKYPADLKNFHFDIQVIQGEMVFDYRLKEGACTIFNASILLKKIGIEIS